MIVISIEARTSKKAGVARSEGSERRLQQEFVGRGWLDLRRFESFCPTSDDHTSANFVLDSQPKLGVEGRRRWDTLGTWTLVKAARRYSPLRVFIYGPSVRELGRIGRLGVSGRRSAAKTAAPYNSRQSRPVEASPEACVHRRCF
jgi:hypothetical protein